jgi:hypothetical protein
MEDIVREAREAIQLSHDFDRDNRREAMEDLRFVAGFQWSDAARQERLGRPMITINRSSQFLRQVSNPIRQNMPTIKVEPDSDDDLNMAEIANGLLRRIQYNSSASHVYASAVEHMVACGIGWFRCVTDYIDKESFDQEILIKRIFNPLSVYPDPSSLEPDRSNMNWCVVSEVMPQAAFKKKYPKHTLQGVDQPSQGQTGSVTWGSSGENVRVAEYWVREEKQITLLRLTDGTTQDVATFSKRGLEYLKFNNMIAGERKSSRYTVKMSLVSGAEQLEDTYECPCQWIPIIPVIGSEVPLESGVYRHGLIRFQREPQQLHNYFMSVAAEALGQQPKAPMAVTPNQIKGFKNVWDNANRIATPYLPYNPDPQAPGPPKRIDPAPLPSGLIQMAQMLADDMKATTGIYDAALGARSNETSGVAIGQRVEQGNQATFHFSDNLEHGLEHLGRVILDMIPKVYDTQRTLRLMSEDDTETEVTVNAPAYSYENGEPTVINDLSDMSFKSVRVTMGPSYATKRAETAQNLIQLVQASPLIQEVGMDMVVRAQDFDGADEMAKRLKAFTELKYPGVTQAQEGPGGAMMPPQQPPVDPMQEQMAQAQMQGQQQAMEFELQGAEAKAAQEQAKAQQAGAKAQGEALKNALLVKKLREPPPRPSQGFDGPRQ